MKQISRVLVATTYSPDDRTTLCVVRSLAKHGVAVVVGGDRLEGRAFHSRFAAGRVVYPHPGTDPEGFTRSIQRILSRDPFDVLLPVGDSTTRALAMHQGELDVPGAIPIPPLSAIQSARDKLETLGIAKRLGIDVPETCCPGPGEDTASALGGLRFPCVVKPRVGAAALGVSFPDSPQALAARLERSEASSLLVQEHVPGAVHDVCALFRRGEPRAVLTQKRLLTFPTTGGAGIVNETTDDPELAERAIALLRELRWHGPAQVEFKMREDGGSACLMEVNGRFWGTLDLSVAAGVDFPLLTCRMAVDGDVAPVGAYRVGLRHRWPFPYAVLIALEGGPSRWRALRTLLAPARDTRSDLWLSDPLPLFAEAISILRRLARHRGRRLRSGDP